MTDIAQWITAHPGSCTKGQRKWAAHAHITKGQCTMTDQRDNLKAAIETVITGIQHLSVDDAADLIAEVADDIAGENDLFNGAILDGIRWGYHAAVTVEMGGGAMVRVIEPGGIGITHEWASAKDAHPQIKAALAAIMASCGTVTGVGEDDHV